MTGDRIAARERVLLAALDVVTAERKLALSDEPADDRAIVLALGQAEGRLELAARDLTNAVDDSPPSQRPAGWARGQEETG